MMLRTLVCGSCQAASTRLAATVLSNTTATRGLALGPRERIAGSVYGTIVVLAVLADGSERLRARSLEARRAGSCLCSHPLDRAYLRARTRREPQAREAAHRKELAAIISHELAIPLASVLLLAAISFGALCVVDDSTAVWTAVVLGAVTLAIRGVRFARLERLSLAETVAAVAINLSLVVMIVALKVPVSP